MLKTDKRDALGLANRLYSQLELGVQVEDKMQLVRRALPPTRAAVQLKGLIQRRYELSHQCPSYRNKLTAICDEIFPEFTHIFRDPNRPGALAMREQFPTLESLTTASLTDLKAASSGGRLTTQRGYHLSDAKLTQLQDLARQSIGTRDVERQRSLLIEQKQLIHELRLMLEHLEQLDAEITGIATNSRGGQILLSIPPMGAIQAATIIAAVSNIANFEKASELKAYLGWAPRRDQPGVSFDRTRLATRGIRPVKQMLFLMASRAITLDCEWARIYQRLLPRLATYDERIKDYRGKLKVIGRIAGQMASMIFALLKTDQELLSQVPPGEAPPPPMLYDPAIHRKHQQGAYRSLKPGTQPRKIIHLPKQTS